MMKMKRPLDRSALEKGPPRAKVPKYQPAVLLSPNNQGTSRASGRGFMKAGGNHRDNLIIISTNTLQLLFFKEVKIVVKILLISCLLLIMNTVMFAVLEGRRTSGVLKNLLQRGVDINTGYRLYNKQVGWYHARSQTVRLCWSVCLKV